jgi:parallel beta-helix repeat protein
LEDGQVGCLWGGVYTEGGTLLKITKPGITLRSAPGERATIKARVYVTKGADGVTIRNLNLDGSPSPRSSPTINANYTKWIGNDVTNHHKSESCFLIGDYTYGIATGTLIQGNRIHDCGRLPRTNHDHGIYLKVARNTRIVGNQIFDNADRGIQLRTDAQRTTIKRNVIDGNGQGIIFSGSNGKASSYNTVENNVISFSAVRHNVESWYPGGSLIGVGNVVRNNCVYGGARGSVSGGIQFPTIGFSATSNVLRDPLYVNRQAEDFHLRSGSPCKAILAG